MNIFCRVVNTSPPTKSPEETNKVPDSVSNEDINKLCEVEFKSQSYASFYNTKMEKDKSILALSVAGLGFLITLLKLSDTLSIYDMSFFALATVSFLTAIYSIITVFEKNAEFIIDLVQNKDIEVKQHVLSTLDNRAIVAFYLAIVFSLLLGISTSSAMFAQGARMSDKSNNQETQETIAINESLRQASELKKSFQGASSMQPQAKLDQDNSESQPGAAGMKPKVESKDTNN